MAYDHLSYAYQMGDLLFGASKPYHPPSQAWIDAMRSAGFDIEVHRSLYHQHNCWLFVFAEYGVDMKRAIWFLESDSGLFRASWTRGHIARSSTPETASSGIIDLTNE
eukprot:ANDGO_01360.mRNA.1 hypothetical protein